MSWYSGSHDVARSPGRSRRPCWPMARPLLVIARWVTSTPRGWVVLPGGVLQVARIVLVERPGVAAPRRQIVEMIRRSDQVHVRAGGGLAERLQEIGGGHGGREARRGDHPAQARDVRFVSAEVDAERQGNRDQSRVLARVEENDEVRRGFGDQAEPATPLQAAGAQPRRQVEGALADISIGENVGDLAARREEVAPRFAFRGVIQSLREGLELTDPKREICIRRCSQPHYHLLQPAPLRTGTAARKFLASGNNSIDSAAIARRSPLTRRPPSPPRGRTLSDPRRRRNQNEPGSGRPSQVIFASRQQRSERKLRKQSSSFFTRKFVIQNLFENNSHNRLLAIFLKLLKSIFVTVCYALQPFSARFFRFPLPRRTGSRRFGAAARPARHQPFGNRARLPYIVLGIQLGATKREFRGVSRRYFAADRLSSLNAIPSNTSARAARAVQSGRSSSTAIPTSTAHSGIR